MRFFSAAAFAFAVPALVVSAPTIMTRQQSEATIAVIKFATVLEQLETEFYTQALKKFNKQDFVAAGFTISDIAIEQISGIQSNEATHTDTLTRALRDNGDMPIEDCRLDFGGALNDVATMVATARVLELVGVGAYIGGAGLITDLGILAAAASILTNEARHQSILNALNSANAIPQAFDVGLTPGEVLTIASAFVSGCNIPDELNFDGLGLEGPKAPLQVTNTGAVNAGTKLDFDSPALRNGDLSGLSCQMVFGGAAEAQSFPADNCIVPQGIEGPVILFLTSDSQPLQSNVNSRLAKGAADVIVAGPTIAFIDVKVDSLGALLRNNPNPVESTQTISPEEAQQLISATSFAGYEQTSTLSADESFSTSTLSAEESFSTSLPNNVEGEVSNSDILVLGVTFIDASP